MKILAVCGVGLGTSAILKLNAERALERLGIDAEVQASDLAGATAAAADAQVVLTSTELAGRFDPGFAELVLIENYVDLAEITAKIETALG